VSASVRPPAPGDEATAKRSDQPGLHALVQAFQAGLSRQLWGVVLFGSAARGEARDASDLDLLVVADGLPDRFGQRIGLLRDLVPASLRGKVSFIARTRAEFETEFPAYYLDIGLDGIILFDRDGYLGARLARIRELIRAAGLSRHRGDQGFSWRWVQPPTGHWRIDWSGVTGL